MSGLMLLLMALLTPWLWLGRRAGIVRGDLHLCGVDDIQLEAMRPGTARLYESPDAVLRRALFPPQRAVEDETDLRAAIMANALPILFAALVFPGGLFALAFGLALKGADRRVAARLQGRVGPPLAQPFFDLVKLGFKRMMAPISPANRCFLARRSSARPRCCSPFR